MASKADKGGKRRTTAARTSARLATYLPKVVERASVQQNVWFPYDLLCLLTGVKITGKAGSGTNFLTRSKGTQRKERDEHGYIYMDVRYVRTEQQHGWKLGRKGTTDQLKRMEPDSRGAFALRRSLLLLSFFFLLSST